jgi:hypothetical protein
VLAEPPWKRRRRPGTGWSRSATRGSSTPPRGAPRRASRWQDHGVSVRRVGRTPLGADPAGRLIEYLTDVDGRRVGRKADGRLTDGFLYDADGAIVAWLGEDDVLRAAFTPGRKTHVPEAMQLGGVLYRLVTDQVGSVRLVVNTPGEIAQRID